jgi:phage regulator Rha-like protein
MVKGTGDLLPVERVQRRILVIRGHRVLLDGDLAEAYGVEVRLLNQAVKRNKERFPSDFAFQLSMEETEALRSQSVILKRGQHRKYRQYAFTEHGAVMLASVLRSPVAIQASIAVVRAFVRLRQVLADHEVFHRKLEQIEKRLVDHDQRLVVAFDAIRQLMEETAEEPSKPRIGYATEADQ